MSRVELQPKNPEHEIVVGLDRPLNTFFISVMQVQAEDDLRDLPPVEFRDRWDRSEVVEKIEEYAIDNAWTKEVKRAIFLDLDPAQVVPEKIPDDNR